MDIKKEKERLDTIISFLLDYTQAGLITHENVVHALSLYTKAMSVLFSIRFVASDYVRNFDYNITKEKFIDETTSKILKGYTFEERRKLHVLSSSDEYRDLFHVFSKLDQILEFLKTVSFSISSAVSLLNLEYKVSGRHF